MISKKEESIYNSHLYISRQVKNKPVRLRSNFDKLSDKDVICLKKLSKFFNNYRNINYSDWFISPYKVYGADDYFDLQFFTTRKALKCYTMYMKQRETQNPDSEETINCIKEGLSFIYRYCIEHNLTLEQYKVSVTGNMPTILTHLKEHRITFYMLHLLEVDVIIKSVETAILNFIVSDFWNIYSQTKIKFVNSKQLKQKARKGKQIIATKLVANNKQ